MQGNLLSVTRHELEECDIQLKVVIKLGFEVYLFSALTHLEIYSLMGLFIVWLFSNFAISFWIFIDYSFISIMATSSFE